MRSGAVGEDDGHFLASETEDRFSGTPANYKMEEETIALHYYKSGC